MNISDLKSQAHRLGAFLKSNPEKALSVAAGKQSACFEAVAAVHGFADWNTLRGTVGAAPPVAKAPAQDLQLREALQTPEPDPELGSVFGKLHPGDVLFHETKNGFGPAETADLCSALGIGYSALLLHYSRTGLRHLALALGGVATTPSQQQLVGGRLLTAQAASVDYSAWKLTQAILGSDISAVDRNLVDLLQTIELRARPGQIVLVESLGALEGILGTRMGLLAATLSRAARAGALVVCIADSQEAFETTRRHLTPTMETVRRSLVNV